MTVTAYNREYNFSNYQASAPSTPLPGSHLDAELNRIKVTLDSLQDSLGLIQRDDGDLMNASVGADQLDGTSLTGINAGTKWLTATAYTTADFVFNGQKFYHCLVAHTSGTFATDLAAAKWLELVDFSVLTPATTAAQGVVELATDAEAIARASSTVVLTPSNLAGVFGTVGPWVQVQKTADETIQSDNTVSDDSVLLFAVLANTKYAVRGRLFFNTPAAADFQFEMAGPAAPTYVQYFTQWAGALTAGTGIVTSRSVDGAYPLAANHQALSGSAGGGWVSFELVIHNGVNAGNVAVRWAQVTSTASNTTVKAGSFLEYRVVA